MTEGNTEGTSEPEDSVTTTRPAPLSKEQLQRDYDEAKSVTKLAKMYGMKWRAVRKMLADAEITVRDPGAAGRRSRWSDPAQHERASDTTRESWNTPGRRENHAEIVRQLWENPERPLYHWDREGQRERQSQKWLEIVHASNGAYVPTLEIVLRDALKRASLSFTAPAIMLNGKYVVDVLLLQHRLVIEADGSSHVNQAAREHDAQRDRDLIAARFRVVRFLYNDLAESADDCVRSLNLPAEDEPRWVERGHLESFGLRSSVIGGKIKADDDIV